MSSLGAIVTQAIVLHYGRDAFLQRLSHPFWFQSFGAVMGMDWHSSGITTSVIGALKRGLGPLQDELGNTAAGPSVESFIAGERVASPDLDGRSVFGWERDLAATEKRTG